MDCFAALCFARNDELGNIFRAKKINFQKSYNEKDDRKTKITNERRFRFDVFSFGRESTGGDNAI